MCQEPVAKMITAYLRERTAFSHGGGTMVDIQS